MNGKSKLWKAYIETDSAKYEVEATRLLYRNAPIERMSFMKRAIVSKVVGNPVTYTFRATLKGTAIESPLAGIMEVSDTNE